MSSITSFNSSFPSASCSSSVPIVEELHPIPPSEDSKGKLEEPSISAVARRETAFDTPAAIDALSDDVLFIIFSYVIDKKGQETTMLQNLRQVSRRWYGIIETSFLRDIFWRQLQTVVKKPQLQATIQEISEAADAGGSSISSFEAENAAGEGPVSDCESENAAGESSIADREVVPAPLAPSYLPQFSRLAQHFIDSACPLEIDEKPIVFGFQAEFYDQLQDRVDISLRLAWSVLRKKLLKKNLFQESELPEHNARTQVIRDWLRDPVHLAKMASLTHFAIELGVHNPSRPQTRSLPLTLSLGSAPFSGFPRELCALSHLTALNLNYNYDLTSLPLEIGNLIQLKRLNISRNRLKSLPHTIGNLTNLKYLYARYNHLTRLPRSVANLIPRLKDHDLSSNRWILIGDYTISLNEPDEMQQFSAQTTHVFQYNGSHFKNGCYRTNRGYLDCLSYPCRTPLGALFQQLLDLGSEEADLQLAFDNLPKELQERIDNRFALSGPSHRKGNRFADRAPFVRTVTRIMQDKLNSLSLNDLGEIYLFVYEVAKRQNESFLTSKEAKSFWKALESQIKKPKKYKDFRNSFDYCPAYDGRSREYMESALEVLSRARSSTSSSNTQTPEQIENLKNSLMGMRIATVNIIRFIDVISKFYPIQ